MLRTAFKTSIRSCKNVNFLKQIGSRTFASNVEMNAPISESQLASWKEEFYKCPKNIVAQNVCTKMDPFDACMSRRALESINHVFQTQVKNIKKPVTNQKSSGRCWLFAALNTVRVRFGSDTIDELEFSQSHLFFWDKIERCNYFLHNIVNTAKRGEKVDGRLVAFLLNDPICDGGQWDMLVNLIQKHGLMPKQCFPESFSSESSMRMNAILKSKLREYTKVLRDLIQEGANDEKLQEKIKEQMAEIYKIVGICLGIPPDTFTWEYYDKSKNHHRIGPITPKNFYETHVKPSFNVEDKYVFVTDPRPTNPFNNTYTVDCLGNVVGGRPVLYNNQPPELLMTMVQNSITDGEPVWFGCEVSKRFASKQGIEDLDVHDFKSMFNVDIQKSLNKADRLLYGESAMTHAMVFTGFSKLENGSSKYRVENSWGEDRGDKGHLVMSSDWFKEFVFEVVIDKKYIPEEVLQVFKKEPTVMPAWDPMGTLAQ